ncbi:MAG: hypothetical protein JKY25_06815 [Robiginitomaculum sp.]|nr:hypothetical protein [Robiginitomaculum sp.]
MLTLPGQENFVLDDYPLYNLNRTSATYMNGLLTVFRKSKLNSSGKH